MECPYTNGSLQVCRIPFLPKAKGDKPRTKS
jgi:hypothetical protein